MEGEKAAATATAGKGKEKDENQSSSSQTESPRAVSGHPTAGYDGSSSIASRVTESAAHLARSLLASLPEPSDLAQLFSNSKAEASGSRPRPVVGESSSSIQQQQQQQQRPIASNSTIPGSGTFRSSQAQHAVQAELEFSTFLDDTSVFVLSEPHGQSTTEASGVAWGRSQDRDLGGQHGAPIISAGDSVAEQEARDGSEVVNLLSDPVNDMDLDHNIPLSDTDASSLRLALFGSDSQGGLSSRDWDNVLNFIPDFVRPDSKEAHRLEMANFRKSEESYAALGVLHTPEAEKLWLDQWMGVLTSYNDEVWGDLGDLVKKAKEEISQLEQAPPSEVPPAAKAVQRLQMILGHIRGY